VFLPLAEEAQLMRPLTELVLDQALAQAAIWRRQDTPVTVAVNLSATNVLDPDIVADVRRMLDRHCVAPDRMVLEITEGVLLADAQCAAGTLHELRALGLAISVDDFGTGFSSLAHLRELPVDALKLDRSSSPPSAPRTTRAMSPSQARYWLPAMRSASPWSPKASRTPACSPHSPNSVSTLPRATTSADPRRPPTWTYRPARGPADAA
jgi:hypothetical protein